MPGKGKTSANKPEPLDRKKSGGRLFFHTSGQGSLKTLVGLYSLYIPKRNSKAMTVSVCF
jgi:hypothetical protein